MKSLLEPMFTSHQLQPYHSGATEFSFLCFNVLWHKLVNLLSAHEFKFLIQCCIFTVRVKINKISNGNWNDKKYIDSKLHNKLDGLISAKKIFLIYHNSGPWFNLKMSSYQNRKSHCGDKTILRPSHLHNGIFYTGKMSSLYWIGALSLCTDQLTRWDLNKIADILQTTF